MFEFKPSEDIISMSKFRTTLASCASRAKDTSRPLILTQNGRAAYVFMDVSAFEEMRNKLETYEDLLVAEGEADRGETVSHKDFMSEVRANRKSRARRMRKVAI